ncbi:uncharacterized protein LOC118516980 [Anopheles stephensi]|uniref:uncharacterized protein LOC118516980 n=1 Tax=Anopheles stephensi TaxID=30069 RepID=UPI001658ABE9|nr:uncharacterized protein LOC118516980 [Anopheles stephensi]
MPKDFNLISDLIEAYKNYPCLWDKSNANFKNLHVKQTAYGELLEVVQLHAPDASIDSVKKKILNLKKSFQVEQNKILKSARSGAGSGEVYVPKLWYYEQMLFLKDSSEAPRVSSMDSDFEEEIIEEEIIDSIPNHPDCSFTSDEAQDQPGPSQSRKRRYAEPVNERNLRRKVMQLVVERMENPSRQTNASTNSFGSFIDMEINKMPPDMEIRAKKLITDVIWMGRKGELTDEMRMCKPD